MSECEHEIFSDKLGEAKCRKCNSSLLYIYHEQQTELMIVNDKIDIKNDKIKHLENTAKALNNSQIYWSGRYDDSNNENIALRAAIIARRDKYGIGESIWDEFNDLLSPTKDTP